MLEKKHNYFEHIKRGLAHSTARPELEVLFESSDSIDQGMSVYILRWAEVLRKMHDFGGKQNCYKEIAN